MALVDLKRSSKEKREEADEAKPVAADQPDYGYGLRIRLEDHELEKLGMSGRIPQVGDEYHLAAIARVTGVNQVDYGKRKEASVELQITMMDATHEDEAEEEGEAGTPESELAEEKAPVRTAKTLMTGTYRGAR